MASPQVSASQQPEIAQSPEVNAFYRPLRAIREIREDQKHKRPFAATVWKEGDWYVSQCLEIDLASQSETETEALDNLTEALDLYFEPPQETRPPVVRMIEVEVGAA